MKESFQKEKCATVKRKKLLSADYFIKKQQPFGTRRKQDKNEFITYKTNLKVIFKIFNTLDYFTLLLTLLIVKRFGNKTLSP